MGWVTLVNRKKELTQDKAYYQLQDLQISRQLRRMAREKAYQNSVFLNEKKKDLKVPKNDYYTLRDALNKKRSDLNDFLSALAKYQSEAGTSAEYNATSKKYKNSSGVEIDSTEYGNLPNKANFKTHTDVSDGSSDVYYEYTGNCTGVTGYQNDPFTVTGTNDLVDSGTRYVTEEAYSALSFQDDFKEIPVLDISGTSTDTISLPFDYTAADLGISLNGTTSTSDLYSSVKTTVDNLKSQIETDLSDAQLKYQEECNDIKDRWDTEMEYYEEEASEEETALEQEKTDIEAQMESISAELEALGDAASTEIKNTTIKLA